MRGDLLTREARVRLLLDISDELGADWRQGGVVCVTSERLTGSLMAAFRRAESRAYGDGLEQTELRAAFAHAVARRQNRDPRGLRDVVATRFAERGIPTEAVWASLREDGCGSFGVTVEGIPVEMILFENPEPKAEPAEETTMSKTMTTGTARELCDRVAKRTGEENPDAVFRRTMIEYEPALASYIRGELAAIAAPKQAHIIRLSESRRERKCDPEDLAMPDSVEAELMALCEALQKETGGSYLDCCSAVSRARPDLAASVRERRWGH